jgi:DNA-binding NarL/FixJ family response regulator
LEVLALVAKGLSNKEVGARLHISEATVARHLVNVFDKLHVRCRTEAAAKYLQSNSSSPFSGSQPGSGG